MAGWASGRVGRSTGSACGGSGVVPSPNMGVATGDHTHVNDEIARMGSERACALIQNANIRVAC